MANLTIQRATRQFAIGDTVGLYRAEAHWDPVVGPAAAALSTAVVASDGTLAFTGLQPGAAYWVAADQGTYWAKLNQFMSPTEDDAQQDHIRGTEYYVDAVSGGASNDGLAWDSALSTVAAAVALASTGDTIYLSGKTREQGVVIPSTKAGITIKGSVAGMPSHADAPFAGGAACWLAPTVETATTPLLEIRSQACRVEGILFGPPTDAEAIKLTRNNGAEHTSAEYDASHAVISNCRFNGGMTGIGIREAGQGIIEDCRFLGITTSTGRAIYAYAGDGVSYPTYWEVRRCRFMGNDNDIVAPANAWYVHECTFDGLGTTAINFTGGTGANIVTNNYLGGAYNATLYKRAGASDEWAGNQNVAGVTTADPT